MGGRGGWVRGMEEGTCWDEHGVLYGKQLDNKFHTKNKIKCKFKCRCLGPTLGLPDSVGLGENLPSNQIPGSAVTPGPGSIV